MTTSAAATGDRDRPMSVIDPEGLQQLIEALGARGYRVLGPTVRDGAILYDELESTQALPAGWTDAQEGGTYRLERRADEAFFGYAVGPRAWKHFLFPPDRLLWRATRSAESGGFAVTREADDGPPMAFLGVRACELEAIKIQDRVFMEGPYVDPVYQARRQRTLIVAVNCGSASATCFCTSMQTGPEARGGFDLALTELLGDGRHAFLVEAGTETGEDLVAELAREPATEADLEAARQVVARTAASLQRSMDTTDLRDLLLGNLEHPRWAEVADRCLACTNCTLVCPTCFCSTVEDTTDLSGEVAERRQTWDSCFTAEFSYIHGGSIRSTRRSRYRQWMTHKLASWIDQFGTSGCVGCGRCITWCPVGIDITEEVRAIRDSLPGREAPRAPQNGHGAA